MRLHLIVVILLAVLTTALAKQICPTTCNCKIQKETATTGIWYMTITECSSPLSLDDKFVLSNQNRINKFQFENLTIDQIRNTFTTFKNLNVVSFKNCIINNIESESFNTPHLKILTFEECTIGQIPDLISDYLTKLTITNCNLPEIPKLNHLLELTELQLNNNAIKNIYSNTFAKLINLSLLNLSNNYITAIPSDSFDNNQLLNTLHLDNNPLKELRISNATNLEHITLKSCALTSFDANISKNISMVNYLDLSDNHISNLPIDAFTAMEELNYIDLSNNKLVEIDDNIFDMNCDLERIILDGNQLNKLPKFICNHVSFITYTFSCKNCGLTSIDNAFDNMPGILNLYLTNNNIHNISKVFSKIKGLSDLDLSNNNIERVSVEAFENNRHLQSLNMSGNPLKPLDPLIFSASSNLKKLYISNCQLEKIWNNYNAVLLGLERLIISHNNLTIITEKDLEVTPNLKLIDLENNPLNCTKDLQDVIEWLNEKSVHPIENSNKYDTHESLISNSAAIFDTADYQKISWRKLGLKICGSNSSYYEDEILDYEYSEYNDEQDGIRKEDYTYDDNDVKTLLNDTDLSNDNENDLNYDDEYEYYEDMKQDNDRIKNSKYLDELSATIIDSSNVAHRASYILSVTSVFILTALVVLTVAVALTLCILKRNGTFNMHHANLPRLKIPLWHTIPTQRKHIGSVYKPLSEDLSGPKTPMINRYDFKITPTIHNPPQ